MTDESMIRLLSFTGSLLLLALWEFLSPRRVLTTSKAVRWFGNLGIVLLNTVVLRALFPVLAVDLASMAEINGWGILNNYSQPDCLTIILGVIALDLLMYLQHILFHSVPLFWRLHMMHHADLDVDVSTGLRFHPLEVILSMGLKMAAVAALGPPAVSVIIFEVVLNATSMFNHGNILLSTGFDRVLRLFVVTPDMHRVHHSVTIRETNSNFGFNLSWWDRLFGTYRPEPAAEHKDMVIGLSQFRDTRRLTLPWMLVLPFTGDPGAYAINQRGKEPRRGASVK